MPFDTALRQLHYRVAIIGGGPAGSACALALAQRGVSDILIVEAGDYSQFRIGESIPPESSRLFQALGIHQAFLREGHVPCYGSCSYWGSDKRGYNDTVMNPLGHGWHLDRRQFDRFLATEAQSRGAHILTHARLKASASVAQSGFELDLALGAQANQRHARIQADFVVDASGTRAVFARQRGSRKLSTLPLVCLAARFTVQEPQSPRSSLTHLEAVEHGWWYGAQLPNGHLLLAFYSDAATIKAHRLHRPERWMAMLRLAANSAKLLCHTEPLADGILSYPAPSYCLDQLCGPNWVAIGDAASAYDPITSQGILKALANGLSAANAISGRADVRRFAQEVEDMYQRYLAVRDHYYRLEQRWVDSPFWRRQHTTEDIESERN